MSALSDQPGQTLVLSALVLTILLGMSALALDVGSWYRADRAAQAAANAAALAAAQALPFDPSEGRALAAEYATKTDGGLKTVAFGSAAVANDTVTVEVERPSRGFLSRVLGLDPVTVEAKASARAMQLAAATGVAPLGVDEQHPLVSGSGCPCYSTETQLELGTSGTGFRLLDLNGSRGSASAAVLADWTREGFDGEMPLGRYRSDAPARFSSAQMRSALGDRLESELLLPVYKTVKGTGRNAEYEVVGWIGFHLTGFEATARPRTLEGRFTRFAARGEPAARNNELPSFGTYSVSLVE